MLLTLTQRRKKIFMPKGNPNWPEMMTRMIFTRMRIPRVPPALIVPAVYYCSPKSASKPSDGRGMMKTGFLDLSKTIRDTLPRKVCSKNPFP